ncbi:MAG: hypothetical protein IKB62_07540 [Oscillospiraceae bacterium]|nr:hypothetical protein [Oscillospiraceae bacterium]
MSYGIKADYRTMYYTLTRQVTKAIGEIEKGNYLKADSILKKAQRECEDIFADTYVEIEIDDGKDVYL